MKKKSTLKEGTDNLCINMPIDLKGRLVDIAFANDMKISEFCRIILQDAVDQNVIIEKAITINKS